MTPRTGVQVTRPGVASAPSLRENERPN